MSEMPLDFPALLEKAIDWASDLEAQILESGRELASNESIDARLAGVKEPARIRLLAVPLLPLPEDESLLAANRQIGLVTPDGAGLAIGYAVLIREEFQRDRRSLVHEFVHVAQYERIGGVDPFLREYLTEVARAGYQESALEKEAVRRTLAIVGER